MICTIEKNTGNGDEKCWYFCAVLKRTVREGLTEKVPYGQRNEKGKEVGSGLEPRTAGWGKVRKMAMPGGSRNIQEARMTEGMNWGKGEEYWVRYGEGGRTL